MFVPLSGSRIFDLAAAWPPPRWTGHVPADDRVCDGLDRKNRKRLFERLLTGSKKGISSHDILEQRSGE